MGTEFTKIAIRHLTWERPDSTRDIIEQFIKETEGAEFEAPLKKKEFSEAFNNEEESKGGERLVEEGRAFFSSELVTKAYKCAEIMQPTAKHSSNFLPVTWTSDKAFKLVERAHVGLRSMAPMG